MTLETRTVSIEDIDLGDGLTFRGHAALFDTWSHDLGGFRERIQKGAFTRTLAADHDIRMFLNHDSNIVLGSTRAGTLRLSEDERGLAVEADLPDTQAGRDLSTLITRGDVHAMSFGFRVPKGGDVWEGRERTLVDVDLAEVSPVTGWEAYAGTTASVRSLEHPTYLAIWRAIWRRTT
jgi:HK97 family phage prohead protease